MGDQNSLMFLIKIAKFPGWKNAFQFSLISRSGRNSDKDTCDSKIDCSEIMISMQTIGYKSLTLEGKLCIITSVNGYNYGSSWLWSRETPLSSLWRCVIVPAGARRDGPCSLPAARLGPLARLGRLTLLLFGFSSCRRRGFLRCFRRRGHGLVGLYLLDYL